MAKEFWQDFMQMIKLHRGRVIGGIIGFVVGILVLVVGFWKTILVLIFTALGYYLGSRWDLEGDLRKMLDRLLPPQFK